MQESPTCPVRQRIRLTGRLKSSGPGNLKKSTSGYPQRLYNAALQGALGINQDGIFGANTEKAVKAFQAAHNLTADGIVGTRTKAALSKLL